MVVISTGSSHSKSSFVVEAKVVVAVAGIVVVDVAGIVVVDKMGVAAVVVELSNSDSEIIFF